MTYDDYLEYYTEMVKTSKITENDAEAGRIAEKAIKQGLSAFWGAWNWYFKENQTTLAIASSAENTVIKDFESFRIAKEQASLQGYRLKYRAKEEFDKLVPKTDTFATGKPQIFTVYRDIGDRKWRFATFPRPDSNMTIYLSVYIEAGEEPKKEIDLIPQRFQSGLEAFIGWKIYPAGDLRRRAAYIEVKEELKRLQVQNRLDMSSPNFMPDGTEERVSVERPWI